MTTSRIGSARQAAILAMIAGLHVGGVMLVMSGLHPRLDWLKPAPPPYIYVLPAPPEVLPLAPRPPGPVEYGLPSQPEPQVRLPDFGDAKTPPPKVRNAAEPEAGSGPGEPAPDVRPPSLRVRDGRLAALIDACYPSASRRAGEEGRVVVQARIDADGRLGGWNIVERSGFARLDAAVDCIVRRLEFVPGRRDGEEVAASAILPIVFRLD